MYFLIWGLIVVALATDYIDIFKRTDAHWSDIPGEVL